MKEIKCLGCENMVVQTPKKRPKLYCSDKCRQKVWQDSRRQEISSLRLKKTQDQIDEAATASSNPLINAARGRDASGVNQDEVALAESEGKGANKKKLAHEIRKQPMVSKEVLVRPADEEFMGYPIPKGLKGIELSIWKAEIKEKSK